MTRKKVKLAFIANDSARKATYKKRMKGLTKKVYELSTLCGIDACAIIFSPYDSQPELCPSQQSVQRVLSQFKKMPEMEQNKKMVNQGSFLNQRITKAKEQLKKIKDNRQKEITQVMFQGLTGKALPQNLNMMDLHELWQLIDQKLKEICKRMETLNKSVAASTIGTTNNNTVVADYPSTSLSFQAATAAAAMATSGGEEFMVQHIMEKGGSSSGFDHQMNNNMMNAMQLQQQQWFFEMMNQPQEHMGFGGQEMIFPFGDASCRQSTLWSNPFNYH